MKILTATLALLALATPSAFAVFCALDTGAVHDHAKAELDPENHHSGHDHGPNSAENRDGHHGDQDEESDSCCKKLIASSTVLAATTVRSLGITTHTEVPAMLPASSVADVRFDHVAEPGFFSRDSGPPHVRPPCSVFGRAPPVLFA